MGVGVLWVCPAKGKGRCIFLQHKGMKITCCLPLRITGCWRNWPLESFFCVEARNSPLRSVPRPWYSTRLSGNVVDTRIKVGRQTNYSQERALDPESERLEGKRNRAIHLQRHPTHKMQQYTD